jgi:hypothetical protein
MGKEVDGNEVVTLDGEGADQNNSDLTGKTDEELDKLFLVDDDGSLGTDLEGNAIESKSEEKKDDNNKVDPDKKKEEEELDEVGKLQKQLADSQEFISKQGNDIGDLRKALRMIQLNQVAAPQKDGGDNKELDIKTEDFYADPVGSVQKILAMASGQDKASTDQQKIVETMLREEIAEKVPNLSEIMDDIAVLAKEDGWEDSDIETFKRTGMGTPQTLKGFAARVTLAKTNESLVEENERLKAQLKENGLSIAEKIDKAAKHEDKKPLQSKANNGASDKQAISVSELPELSDKALDAILAKG